VWTSKTLASAHSEPISGAVCAAFARCGRRVHSAGGTGNALRYLHLPLMTQWNLFVERQLVGRPPASAAGNKGTYMGPADFFKSTRELNAAVYIPASTPSNTREFEGCSRFPVSLPSERHNTYYNALQVILEKRFGHGLSPEQLYRSKTTIDFGWQTVQPGASTAESPTMTRRTSSSWQPCINSRSRRSREILKAIGGRGWELTSNTPCSGFLRDSQRFR
jgi:hypothetical protein